MEVTNASQELITAVVFAFSLIFVTQFLGEIFRSIVDWWQRWLDR